MPKKVTKENDMSPSKEGSQPSRNDVNQFYKTFLVGDVSDPKNLNKEILYQLYKKVVPDKGDNAPHIEPMPSGLVQQLDCLFLPDDDGFKFALTVVDVGSRLMDCEPMKEISSKSVLKALKQIYKRGILKMPSQSFQVDAGSEFKGDFKQHFEKFGINIRVAQTGRHRQQGLVESRNKSIATPLLKRQTAEELITGEKSTQWIKYLPAVVKYLNNKFEKKDPWNDTNPDYKVIFGETTCKGNTCDVLNVGTMVRYKLDEPIDVASGKKLAGKFRAGDIKWSMKPVKIEHIQLIPNNPPLYKIQGKTALYTKGQLQIASSDEKLPPSSVQEKYIIDKIIKKINKKGKIFFEVKWKGYDETTEESREKLIKDVPQMVEEFEKAPAKKVKEVSIEDFLVTKTKKEKEKKSKKEVQE